MVLKRVGERVVDVLVNGAQQASYTQTQERADYDVAVSDDSTTFETRYVGEYQGIPDGDYIAPSQTYYPTYDDGDAAGVEGRIPDRIRVEVYGNGGDTRMQIRDGNGNDLYNQLNTDHDTGYLSVPSASIDFIKITNESGSSQTIDVRLTNEYTVSSGYSIDGVTQS